MGLTSVTAPPGHVGASLESLLKCFFFSDDVMSNKTRSFLHSQDVSWEFSLELGVSSFALELKPGRQQLVWREALPCSLLV